MPTLTRLLIVFVVISSVVYGAMLGLVAWVTPVTTELSIDIPSTHLQLHPWPYGEKARPPEPAGASGAKETGGA